MSVKCVLNVRCNATIRVLLKLFSFYLADNHKSITHGLGRYPDFVVVQLKLSNGYISEAGGKTEQLFAMISRMCLFLLLQYDLEQ